MSLSLAPSSPAQCQCEGGLSGPMRAQHWALLTNERLWWRPSLSPLHHSLSLSPGPRAGHPNLVTADCKLY